MLVNGQVITGANGVLGGLDAGSQVQVACRYQPGLDDPDVYKIDTSEKLISSYVQRKYSSDYKWSTYTLNAMDKQGTATYRCIDKNKAGCPDYSQVTISFTTRTPSPGPVLRSNCRPGGSDDRPSDNPSTATYTMLVNNQVITGANGVVGGLDVGSQVQVACRYQSGIADPDVYKIDAFDGSEHLLNSNVQTSFTSSYTQRTYTLTNADMQGTATYRCIDKNKAGCPDYSQMTISFTARIPSPGPVLRSDCRPGGANDRPSVNPSTATYTMLVNNRVITGANGVQGGLDAGSQVQVACRYQSGIADPDVYKIDASDGLEHLLNSNVQTSFTSSYTQRTYTLSNADKQGTATYRCIDKNKAGCPDYSQVTISFSTRTLSPGPILRSDCPPGGANNRPSISPSNIHSTTASSSDGTAAGQRFAGFNPLIYIVLVAAVVVLGTLVIIAIVTCWIRAKRSYNRRMFQSSANPQDHLNYITDNEYTPLTTSEFLQERSPTFHVGEEIQGQMRPEVGDDDMETSNSSSSSDIKSSSI